MGILTGKVAVITGGTRGLGLAIAQAYAREGAAVVLGSRSADTVEQAVQSLRQAGAQASGRSVDVAVLEQVQALASLAVSEYGRFDIWVNNAGLSAPYGPTAHIQPEAFLRVIQTNITGTYNGSVTALRYWLPGRPGKLINLLGRGDRQAVPFQNAYAASKAWVRAFTLALAKEYRDSPVGIFAFNPGLMETEMLDRVQAVAGYEGRLEPLRTVRRMWSQPPEIPARKAVWLASAATDGKTGLEVRTLGPGLLLAGLLREGARRLLGRPAAEVRLEVERVPAAIPFPPEDRPAPAGGGPASAEAH